MSSIQQDKKYLSDILIISFVSILKLIDNEIRIIENNNHTLTYKCECNTFTNISIFVVNSDFIFIF